MAKARKKSAVPKRLAGVKVPKPVRQGLKRLGKTQDGKTVIAEALLAAGAALAAHEAKPGSKTRRAAAAAGKQAKGKATSAQAATAFRATALASAFGVATQAFTEALKAHPIPTAQKPEASAVPPPSSAH